MPPGSGGPSANPRSGPTVGAAPYAMDVIPAIDRAMQRAVEAGVFPGAVLMVRVGGQLAYQGAVGVATRLPEPEPVSPQTIYDLASLTKPLATAGAVLCLIQEGRLSLETPLGEVIEELRQDAVGAARVRHLLNHSAGLPAWLPYYEWVEQRDRLEPGFLGSEAAQRGVADYLRGRPLSYPIGTRSEYSDLGFMLLGLLVERMTGQSLQTYCWERLYAPVRAWPLGFRPSRAVEGPPEMSVRLIAATEDDRWRGRLLRGEAHDENAFAMGGVAGHAGLFGDAAAVLAVSGSWLESYQGRTTVFQPDLARRFLTRQEGTPGSSWALGWDTPTDPSSTGKHFSPRSFGHLGFTGTSLWVDPQCELEVVLLTNRVHPARANQAIRRFRPVIHDLVYETFIGK